MKKPSKPGPFHAELFRPEGTGTSTFLPIPFDVKEVFGSRGRVAVRGAIDGHPFRGSLMPRGDGRHAIVVNKEVRTAIGKEAGDSVVAHFEVDDEPRVVEIPEVFAIAIARHEAAKAAFDKLSYSHRKEFVDWIEGAKKAETQERRAGKAVEMLAAGEGVKGDLPGR